MKKAFTLIELLVVVLIIGILAAIALPQYEAAVEKSRAAEAVLNLKHIQQAFILRNLEDPNYADTLDHTLIQSIVELSGGKWKGNVYCTKHFYYAFEGPDITAYRLNDPNCDTSPALDKVLYYLWIDVPSYGYWANVKECDAFTDTGYRVCKGLEGQGFTTSDER